jgi:hypothetical protein
MHWMDDVHTKNVRAKSRRSRRGRQKHKQLKTFSQFVSRREPSRSRPNGGMFGNDLLAEHHFGQVIDH